MAILEIHCSNCNHKIVAESQKDIDSLVEVKMSNPPRRADGKDKTLFNRGKFFKCPECGYTMKSFNPPDTKAPDSPKPPPTFPKDMDERINSGKMGDDFLKEVDKFMKGKQRAEDRAKKKP